MNPTLPTSTALFDLAPRIRAVRAMLFGNRPRTHLSKLAQDVVSLGHDVHALELALQRMRMERDAMATRPAPPSPTENGSPT